MSEKPGTFVLGGILKRTGVFDYAKFIQDFDERLVLQKTIYLMQAFGLYLGYLFSWYIKGPYSPSLTRDAYSMGEIYQHTPELTFANPQAEARFEEFLKLVSTVKNDRQLLESLASVHFIHHLNPGMSEDELFKEARKRKRLDRATFERVMKLLRGHSLLGR